MGTNFSKISERVDAELCTHFGFSGIDFETIELICKNYFAFNEEGCYEEIESALFDNSDRLFFDNLYVDKDQLVDMKLRFIRKSIPAPLQNSNPDYQPFINCQEIYRPTPFFWDALRIFGPHERNMMIFSKTELFTQIIECRDPFKRMTPDEVRGYVNERRNQIKFFLVLRSLELQEKLLGVWSNPFSDTQILAENALHDINENNWSQSFEWVNYLPAEFSILVRKLNRRFKLEYKTFMRRQTRAITRFRDGLRLDDHRHWLNDLNAGTYVHHLKTYTSMLNVYISQQEQTIKKLFKELEKVECDLVDVLNVLLTM